MPYCNDSALVETFQSDTTPIIVHRFFKSVYADLKNRCTWSDPSIILSVLPWLEGDCLISRVAAIAYKATRLADDFTVALDHGTAAGPAVGIVGWLVNGLESLVWP